MTPASIISVARNVLNDLTPSSGEARQSDAELLAYFNEGLAEICTINPMIFATVGTMVCTPGTVLQTMSFANAVRFIDVLGITGGRSINMFDRSTLDAFNPNWPIAAPAAASQWAALENDPLAFFINAPAPLGQSLDVRYARKPGVYSLYDAVTEIPDNFRPAMVDYVVYRAESKDDENVLSQRAQQSYAAFLAKIGAK